MQWAVVCAVPHTEPREAFAAISERLGPASEATPLEGGITNRNFRVTMGGRDVVVRVPGRATEELGIDRGAEAEAAAAAAELGIGPAVAAVIDDPRCIAVDFVAGETMSAASLQGADEIVAVAEILRTMHDSPVSIPTDFDVFEVVEDHAQRAIERGASLPDEYETASALAHRIRSKLTGALHEPVFTHNDLLPANLIRSDDGAIHLLDWDYAGMGDRFFDLANFAINAELTDLGKEQLLESYFGEADEMNRATLTLMLVMSDFREAMWGVLQRVLSDLDFDFEKYARDHFRRLIETSRRPDFETAIEAESIA